MLGLLVVLITVGMAQHGTSSGEHCEFFYTEYSSIFTFYKIYQNIQIMVTQLSLVFGQHGASLAKQN